MTCSSVRYDSHGAYVDFDGKSILPVKFNWQKWLTAYSITTFDTFTFTVDNDLVILSDESDPVPYAQVLVDVREVPLGATIILTSTVTSGVLEDTRHLRIRIRNL